MNVAISIVLVLIGLYLIFILAPALVMFRSVFGRQEGVPYVDRDLSSTSLRNYEAQLKDEFAHFAKLPYEEVEIEGPEHTRLYGKLYGDNRSEIVVCVHGYHSVPLNSYSTIGKRLIEEGYGVLLIDQRGCGNSEGKHTTFGLKERYDIVAWVRELTERFHPEKITLMGVSMGCATVSYASALLQNSVVSGLILICGYVTSYEQLVIDCRKRKLPARMLMFLIYGMTKEFLGIDLKEPTTKALANNHIPTVFIHGTDDRTVNVKNSKENYESCRAEKRLCLVQGADHNNLFLINHQAQDEVLRILKQ